MKEAATMIILSENGLVLGVSRKRDPSKFGMPRGKVDPGETHRQAAIRETKEECGIIVKDCQFILSRPDEDGYCCHCFLATDWEGTPQSKEEGIVRWCWKGELTDPKSAFPEFNRVAFEILKSKMKSATRFPTTDLIEEVGWLWSFGSNALSKGFKTKSADQMDEINSLVMKFTDEHPEEFDVMSRMNERKNCEDYMKVCGFSDEEIKNLIDEEIRRFKLGSFE